MKRLTLMLVVILLLPLVSIQPADACSFDTDCNVGSKCLKRTGQLYGVCFGGLNPGNTYDRTPVYDPLDVNRSTGNTCQFDTDCGPGSRCAKPQYGGGIYGVCLRGR